MEELHGLRVLMLTASYHPRAGGVEKHVRCVGRELRAMGIEVWVATPRWEEGWDEEELLEGVLVRRLSTRMREGRKQLEPLLDWAQVVHTHDAYPFLKYYWPYRLRRRRLPVFVTWHGYECYPIPREAKLLRRVVGLLTKDCICVGAFIPKWYKFSCSRITYGGVDAPAQRPPPGEGAVFVGRLEPDTGILDYIEAIAQLRDKHGVELPFEVCGAGSLMDMARKRAAEKRLEVVFHGQVRDPMPYFARARFACVSGYLAMLEAMASGAIVLALYDNPLKEDYLRMSPMAVNAVIAGSPEELADRTAALMRSPAEMERLAEGGYEFAKGQTWRRVAELYAGMYARWLLRRR